MSQSSVIAFGLLIGFLVFITIRGELADYLCVIGLSNQCKRNIGASGFTCPAGSVGVAGFCTTSSFFK